MPMLSIQRNGFFTFQSLVQQLVIDMDSNGFTLDNVDGQGFNPSAIGITEKAALSATVSVDPIVGQQPWSFCIFFSEEEQWMDFYAVTPEQVIDSDGDFRMAKKRVTGSAEWLAGKLTQDSLHFTGGTFFRSASFAQWGMPDSDTQANPMSYQLCVSDHGVSLAIWVESYDSYGDKFSWFVIQRMVDDSGATIIDGKAPLFGVFSNRGYSFDNTLNEPDARAIMKFVVRESDVNSPTFPVTALHDTADSNRIINGSQQVSIRENNNVVMNFPNGLNTQRHMYPHQLDMISVISADVVSQSTELPVNPFGEASDRIYRGMNADNLFNKGARVLFWVSGGS